MLEEMEALGASRVNIVAKLAGGSQMFPDMESAMVIGVKNAAAAEEYLGKLGIPILSQDVGGNFGRTLEFDCQDGSLYVKTINKIAKI
jgi:chemotaxis protein CheD